VPKPAPFCLSEVFPPSGPPNPYRPIGFWAFLPPRHVSPGSFPSFLEHPVFALASSSFSCPPPPLLVLPHRVESPLGLRLCKAGPRHSRCWLNPPFFFTPCPHTTPTKVSYLCPSLSYINFRDIDLFPWDFFFTFAYTSFRFAGQGESVPPDLPFFSPPRAPSRCAERWGDCLTRITWPPVTSPPLYINVFFWPFCSPSFSFWTKRLFFSLPFGTGPYFFP